MPCIFNKVRIKRPLSFVKVPLPGSRKQKTRDRVGLARVLNLMGDLFGRIGDLQRSLEYFNRALPLWRDLRDRRGEAQALLGVGYNYSGLGDDLKAIEYYDDALGLWQAVNDRRGQALTLHAQGFSYSNLGEKQKTLDLFHRARELTEPQTSVKTRYFGNMPPKLNAPRAALIEGMRSSKAPADRY